MKRKKKRTEFIVRMLTVYLSLISSDWIEKVRIKKTNQDYHDGSLDDVKETCLCKWCFLRFRYCSSDKNDRDFDIGEGE